MNGSTHSPLIKFSSIEKTFDGQKALRSVDVELFQHEFILLTGPSGSGKTTFLNIINNELNPCSGNFDIKLDHQDISVVFQDLRLLEDMSVLDNLIFSFNPKKNYGYKDFKKHVDELLGFFELKKSKNKTLSGLSGGERQLIAVIRAILSMPELILLDEPTSALDESRSKKLYDLIHLYNIKRKMAVVWATHDKDLAKRHSGRTIHLEKGKLIHSGRACFI